MRDRNKLKSTDRYDANNGSKNQSRSSVSSINSNKPKASHGKSRKSVSLPNSLLPKIQSKKATTLKKNLFAAGKNGQNTQTKELVKKSGNTKSNESEIEETDLDLTDTLINNKKKESKQKKAPIKTAACWKFFKEVDGVHPIKKTKCNMVKCIIEIDGKPCGFELIYHSSTSHMNDHLLNEHGKMDFKKKSSSVPQESEINELIAKFIVNSNSSFRIVEDKYLKVSYNEL